MSLESVATQGRIRTHHSRRKREVIMRIILWKAMTLPALAVGMTCAVFAQSATTQSTMTARVDPPATPASATPAPASPAPATPDPTADATHASSGSTQPDLQPTVTQEIEALKSRIDQLEDEVKEEKARALADSADTAAIKAAEKDLIAGGGGAAPNPATAPFRLIPAMQAATPPLLPRSVRSGLPRKRHFPATGPG